MKQISCSDLGCCDDVITAADDAELKTKLFTHAQQLHPEQFKAMTPDMVQAVEAKIHQHTRTV
ncbi:MAG: DUF1059 domain-containing protein [Myxococcaceae bacterium]|nr:DUF1059 domain-containing protein [Myxococcaceae bacterium]MCI0673704.1 DUF1059 domain-containing protein [Myxococcaceae bacterium]